MTKFLRTRFGLAAVAAVLCAAGVVVAGQAFTTAPVVTPAPAGTTVASDASAAVTMTDWTETGRNGSITGP